MQLPVIAMVDLSQKYIANKSDRIISSKKEFITDIKYDYIHLYIHIKNEGAE
jgi:hypothetical protein